MSADAEHEALSGLSVLVDPVRRRLYEYVAEQSAPTRRDDAAAHAGISRTLAAYHLDKLVDAGLLRAGYARPAGAGGPGAGRPAKQYEPVREEVTASIPPRNYRLLADVLATAADADASGQFRETLEAAASREGQALGASGEDVLSALEDGGYRPCTTERGDIEMRNCPFHALAQEHTELVCGLNHALVRGILDGCRQDRSRAELEPHEDRCCVVIRPEPG
jgi:predicted ArsR family transcriptional regulator